jgi:hypothetical protein
MAGAHRQDAAVACRRHRRARPAMAPCRYYRRIVVEAKLSSEETYISLFLFCLIATSSVLVMEIHAVFRPERSRALLARVMAWIDTHTDQAIIIVSVLLGLWLVGKGSYLLAT